VAAVEEVHVVGLQGLNPVEALRTRHWWASAVGRGGSIGAGMVTVPLVGEGSRPRTRMDEVQAFFGRARVWLPYLFDVEVEAIVLAQLLHF
jgi:hypothetical protein